MKTGDTFGRYSIREKIGEGGMGEVYLADDTRLNRKVALKVLARVVADDDERLKRFEQEARAASALNHPNILTVHEFGEEDGAAFLASEYVEGRTLRELITLKELDLRTGLKIAEQTAFALDTAHQAGIIHRDIKPENIMVRKDGFVKILDFGLAKLVEQVEAQSEDETRAHFRTAAGHIVGTATYMSPEQARGKADIDARTDVWSLGVVIHEMFAGRPPFTGESISDVIASVLKTEPESLAHLVGDCPPELDRIVTKALRKDREERYQVIKDLALDVRSLRKQMEFSAQYSRSIGGVSGMLTSEHGHAQTTSFATPARSSWWLGAAGMALIAAIAGGAWFVYSKYGAPPESDAVTLKTVELVNWASQPNELYASGSFSPDGKMIAFASTKSGNKQIWVKQTASGESVQVTTGDAVFAADPIWSPSGEEIAFYSNRGERPGFWRIPVLGGSPTLITYLEDGSSQLRSWSKNGSIYFDSASALRKVDVATGNIETVLAVGSDSVTANHIDISPDEQTVAFVVTEDGKNVIAARRVTGGAGMTLFTTESNIRDVIWHQDSRRVLYSSQVNGTFQIFVVGMDGSPPRQVTFSERDAFALDVSADGTRIMVSSAKEESDLWSVNLADGKETKVISDVDSNLWPAVSPDGKSVAYQSIKNLSQGNNLFNGKVLLWRGSETAPITVAGEGFLPTFSPNGEWIAFIKVMGDKFRIEVTKATGGEQPRMVADAITVPSYSVLPYLRIQLSDLSWAPDSSRIVYVSRKSGNANLWLANLDGAAPAQLTDNSDPRLYLYSPVWSSDGKQVAFTSRVGGASGTSTYGAGVIDAETRSTKQLLNTEKAVRLLGWAEGDKDLILATTETRDTGAASGEVTISSLAVGSGTSREIRVVRDAYARNAFVLPDRRRIIFTAHRDDRDNIWLLPIGGGAEKRVTDNNDSRLYFSSLAFSSGNDIVYFGRQSRYSLLSMITNFK